METSENDKVFGCFPGVEKECIGSKWVKPIAINIILKLWVFRLCDSIIALTFLVTKMMIDDDDDDDDDDDEDELFLWYG